MNSQPLQQSPQFARALAAFGADVASTEPLILRRRFGPLGTLVFASRARVEDVADTPVRVLNGETTADGAYRAAGFRQIITPAHIAEWDLTRADLRIGMHGKWRNRLVKGEAQELRIRESNWDGRAHPLFEHAKVLARKRKFRSYPEELLAVFARLDPSKAILFEAFERGALIAACLILRHGATATYQTAWSAPRGHALQAPRVILWHAAQRMAALGHTTLDLGVVQTDTGAGLARFKLGTGANLRALGGTWVRLSGR